MRRRRGVPVRSPLKGATGASRSSTCATPPTCGRPMPGTTTSGTYLSAYGPFSDAPAFSDWLASRVVLEDPYSYAIVVTSGHALGIAALMEIRPAMRVIEVGHIVYSPALMRTPLGTEAQYLLARYAFETLGYRRYEWKCDALSPPQRLHPRRQ